MNTADFHKLVHLVLDSPAKPPHHLFVCLCRTAVEECREGTSGIDYALF